MERVLIVLLFTLVILVGVILLQIYLSKKESKWPGLVLPIISFLVSFIYPLNMAIPSVGGYIFALILGWLIANIPTIVLLTIYFACRGKQRRNKQLDKMNIQDLG
jgi:hypothetical protein